MKKVTLTQLQARILVIIIVILSIIVMGLSAYTVILKLTIKEYELKIEEIKTGGRSAVVKRSEGSRVTTPTTEEKVFLPPVPSAGITLEGATVDLSRYVEVESPDFSFLVEHMKISVSSSDTFLLSVEASPDVVYLALEASPQYLIDRYSTNTYVFIRFVEPSDLSTGAITHFYSIQLLAYLDFEHAYNKVKLLRMNDLPAFVYSYTAPSGKRYYAVELGVFADLLTALKASKELGMEDVGKILNHDISDRFVRRIEAMREKTEESQPASPTG